MLLACALLSKEDALAVPVIILAGMALKPVGRREWITDSVVMAALVVAYLILRGHTDAITPATAPDAYRLTWRPSHVLENGLHYLDRAGTSTLILLLLTSMAYRTLTPWRRLDHSRLLMAATWFVAGLGLTIAVPVRSSLYVVFPSVAAAILYAACVESCRSSNTSNRDPRLIAVLAAVLLLIRAYGIRNDRYVEPARVSTRAFHAIRDAPAALDSARAVRFIHEPTRFSNFSAGFAKAEAHALKVYTGRDMPGQVVPTEGAGGAPPYTLIVRLANGRVVVSEPEAP